jgi:hypothetical protein
MFAPNSRETLQAVAVFLDIAGNRRELLGPVQHS